METLFILFFFFIETLFTLLPFILFVGFIVLIIKNDKKTSNTTTIKQENHETIYRNTRIVEKETIRDESKIYNLIKNHDFNFSGEDMKQKAVECFLLFKRVWSQKDILKFRPFETDTLFNIHKHQVDECINNNTTQYSKEIKILSTEVINYIDDGDYEILGIKLDTISKDYTLNDLTGKIVKGNKHQENYICYYMEFIRKKGIVTQKGKEILFTNCPNCGATMTISNNGECEYCHTYITNGKFSWVLNEITRWNEKYRGVF